MSRVTKRDKHLQKHLNEGFHERKNTRDVYTKEGKSSHFMMGTDGISNTSLNPVMQEISCTADMYKKPDIDPQAQASRVEKIK